MYQTIDADTVKRLSDGAFIPADPDNRDYRAYQDWLKEGGSLLPAPDPLKPPTTRVERALLAKGLISLADLL